MDFARALSTLLEKEQHRKTAVAAIQLVQQHIIADNIGMAQNALFAAMLNKYDEVRRLAAEIILDNVGILAVQSFDSVLYAVSRVLDTKNLPFNEYECCETVRADLLTVLLKLLIHMQNTLKSPVDIEKAHIRYGDLIIQILTKHSTDFYTECKIQVDKCIYRFSRLFKHFLTETQIGQLSDAIIANFRHNHSAVRQLNLRAFTEVHCAIQSKRINVYLQELFPIILRDQLLTETIAECFYQFLTQHVDRHIYADVFSLPLVAGLYDAYTFERFQAVGEVYVQENSKIDKFLKLQNEIETCVTGREVAFDSFICQFNAELQPHFNAQMSLGCRVLAQQILEKQLDAILRDVQSVQQETKQLSVRLLCNLVILSHNFTLKFGHKFVAALQFLLHDEFNKAAYNRLIQLMSVMCAGGELIQSIKTQIGLQSAENSSYISRILVFIGKFLHFRQTSAAFAPPLNDTEIGDLIDVAASLDCLLNEDGQLTISQLFCTIGLSRYIVYINNIEKLLPVQCSRVFLLLAAVLEKLSSMGYFALKKSVVEDVSALVSPDFGHFDPADIQAEFALFYSTNEDHLVFNGVLQALQLDGDALKTDRLQLKCRIFACFLSLTRELSFASRNAQKAVGFAVRLLRVAADFERNPRAIRAECLECVYSLVTGARLEQDQIIFLLTSLFACTTWKHGARSPECLARAISVMKALLCKQAIELKQPLPTTQEEKSSKFGAMFDRILSRCCVQLEDDYQTVREETLELVASLIEYVRCFDGQFDELGQKLALRLDDARESVTLRALELLEEVILLDKEMFSHSQIAEMLVMHCDDPNQAIRQHCVKIVRILLALPKYRESCLAKAGEMNWQYLYDHDWIQ